MSDIESLQEALASYVVRAGEKLRREFLSKRYTTSWGELAVVR